LGYGKSPDLKICSQKLPGFLQQNGLNGLKIKGDSLPVSF
jgi:hypothetical protein